MTSYSWQCRRNPLVKMTLDYWYGKNVVYRFFRQDQLLYVGMSRHLYGRMKTHRRLAPWWAEHDRLVIKVYPSTEAALWAEAQAIRAEAPIHNLLHNARPVIRAA